MRTLGSAMADTRYASSGNVNIAYQVVGQAEPDLAYVPGWVTNIEVMWEEPRLTRFLRRLASFSRVITFDKRGIGLSDPVPLGALPDLSTRVADLGAVLNAADSQSATLFGHSEGASTAIAFAAQYPERVERLIVFGGYARRVRSDEYPWAPTEEERQAESASYAQSWDDPARIAEYYAPSRADDQAFIAWLGRWLRLSASPAAAAQLNDASSAIDVTGVLSDIRAPTLLLYRLEDRDVKIEEGRYIHSKIAGSRLVELHGADHFFYAGETEPILQEIEEFVTGYRATSLPERALKTVLFTDIVKSTDLAAALGDREWRDLLSRHNDLLRGVIRKWRGSEVVPTGDGFLTTFDGPANAIRCASDIVTQVRVLGIEVRCGIHTGEIELLPDDVTGLAVNIGARIASLAGPSEILVSRTVKDLVVGTGIEFVDRGVHNLKGIPEAWALLAVVPPATKT